MCKTPNPTTKKNREKFLMALAERGHVGESATAVGIDRSTVYAWRKEDPAFEAAYQSALDQSVTQLEDEARRRAHDGWEEPVWHLGQQCGTVRKFSDTLLIFLLKANKPEKYRETSRHEITGANGGPVKYEEMSTSALYALLAEQEAKAGK
jgi:hypothetical protein